MHRLIGKALVVVVILSGIATAQITLSYNVAEKDSSARMVRGELVFSNHGTKAATLFPVAYAARLGMIRVEVRNAAGMHVYRRPVDLEPGCYDPDSLAPDIDLACDYPLGDDLWQVDGDTTARSLNVLEKGQNTVRFIYLFAGKKSMFARIDVDPVSGDTIREQCRFGYYEKVIASTAIEITF